MSTHVRSRVSRPAPAFAVAVMLALLATVLAPGGMPPAAGAAPDEQIPGIPLPGPVVTGRLGGSYYFHVYSIAVPARSVIVASLTGTEGTDFDLFLFDSTATSVWEKTGRVAESNGPTSSESIVYPTDTGGMYYVAAHGASEVEGDFRLTVSIQPDSIPPEVRIAVDGGRTAVNHANVTLDIRATDDLSGVQEMQLHNDDEPWSDWRAYAESIPWTLSDGDGLRQVWIRVRDRAGNLSAAIYAAVLLDRDAPRVVEVRPMGDLAVTDLRPVVSVKFDKGIDPATWAAGGVHLQLGSVGTPLPGEYAYDAPTWTASFRPSVDLIPGAAYTANVGQVKDLAGNAVVPYPSWSFTPLQQSVLGLRASPTSVPAGGTVTLAGTAKLAEPAAVQVERRSADAQDWEVLQSVFPPSDGSILMSVQADKTADYRLHFAGTSTSAEAMSSLVRVTVRRIVELTGADAAVTRSVASGTTVALRSQTTPRAAGIATTFRLYKYDPTKKKYALVANYLRRADASGRAVFQWKTRPGKWYVRVAVPGTSTLAAAISPVYRWTVR
jgi:hypothetical protein